MIFSLFFVRNCLFRFCSNLFRFLSYFSVYFWIISSSFFFVIFFYFSHVATGARISTFFVLLAIFLAKIRDFLGYFAAVLIMLVNDGGSVIITDLINIGFCFFNLPKPLMYLFYSRASISFSSWFICAHSPNIVSSIDYSDFDVLFLLAFSHANCFKVLLFSFPCIIFSGFSRGASSGIWYFGIFLHQFSSYLCTSNRHGFQTHDNVWN